MRRYGILVKIVTCLLLLHPVSSGSSLCDKLGDAGVCGEVTHYVSYHLQSFIQWSGQKGIIMEVSSDCPKAIALTHQLY